MSLLSCQDVFVSRTYLGHNCSVEKSEFKRCEDVLEVEKFCYLAVLLYYCEMWKLTVADDVTLCGVECCMVQFNFSKMICEFT